MSLHIIEVMEVHLLMTFQSVTPFDIILLFKSLLLIIMVIWLISSMDFIKSLFEAFKIGWRGDSFANVPDIDDEASAKWAPESLDEDVGQDYDPEVVRYTPEADKMPYYIMRHPSWTCDRLCTHDNWTQEQGRVIGSAPENWIVLPNVDGVVAPYIAEIFWRDGQAYMVKLNDRPLTHEERLGWENLNPVILEDKFELSGFTVERHVCHKFRDLPATIIGPNIEGEHIANYRGGAYRIGSSEYCDVTLPDPTLPEVMAEKKSLGHHLVLEDYPGFCRVDAYAGRKERCIQRIDHSPFVYCGYLIFQHRDPNSPSNNRLAREFRKTLDNNI